MCGWGGCVVLSLICAKCPPPNLRWTSGRCPSASPGVPCLDTGLLVHDAMRPPQRRDKIGDMIEFEGEYVRMTQFHLDRVNNQLLRQCGFLGDANIHRAWACLEAGGDVDYKDYVGQPPVAGNAYLTPIGIASADGHLPLVHLLLDAGATIRAHDIETAQAGGHDDCVALMVATRDERLAQEERMRSEAAVLARARAVEAETTARARADAVAAELLAEDKTASATRKSRRTKVKKAAAPSPASTPAIVDAATLSADRALEAAMATLDLDCLRSAIETHATTASAEVLASARAKRTRLKKKFTKAAKSGAVHGAHATATGGGATTSRDEVEEAAEPPSELMCPITNEIMEDPVFTEDGQTYERVAIERWLSMNDTAPLTGQKLANRNLTPNVMARGMCMRWLEENRP